MPSSASAKSQTLRLLNEQYEILWTLANAADTELSEEERADLNASLEQLLISIRKVKPLPS